MIHKVSAVKNKQGSQAKSIPQMSEITHEVIETREGGGNKVRIVATTSVRDQSASNLLLIWVF